MSTLLDLFLMATASSSALVGVAMLTRMNKETFLPENPSDDIPFPQMLNLQSPKLVAATLEPFQEFDEEGLSLSLENIGGDLIYQGISIQEDNELRVEYFPEFESPNMNFIPSGQPLRFLLRGSYENATFHFSVIYTDHKGNTYSQKVAGWGLERPLLEVPLELCA